LICSPIELNLRASQNHLKIRCRQHEKHDTHQAHN